MSCRRKKGLWSFGKLPNCGFQVLYGSRMEMKKEYSLYRTYSARLNNYAICTPAYTLSHNLFPRYKDYLEDPKSKEHLNRCQNYRFLFHFLNPKWLLSLCCSSERFLLSRNFHRYQFGLFLYTCLSLFSWFILEFL